MVRAEPTDEVRDICTVIRRLVAGDPVEVVQGTRRARGQTGTYVPATETMRLEGELVVLKDVDRKSIKELSVELNDLVQRTRARKTPVEEMQGGTFTITNMGPIGGGHFTPIINYPEVAIMGMGSARMQPVVRQRGNGRQEIVPRLIMPLVLSVDHRVLDGADAARFMNLVIHALEDPEELLLTMT